MSDQAPAQIVIYDCPEERRVELRQFLDTEFRFTEDFFGSANEDDAIELFTSYGDTEAAMDAYDEVGRAVIRKFPEVSFACWSDPKYEYEGMGFLYTPELGRYDGRFTSQGEPYVTSQEVRAGLLAGDLEKGAGLPWLDALDAFREAVPVG